MDVSKDKIIQDPYTRNNGTINPGINGSSDKTLGSLGETGNQYSSPMQFNINIDPDCSQDRCYFGDSRS